MAKSQCLMLLLAALLLGCGVFAAGGAFADPVPAYDPALSATGNNSCTPDAWFDFQNNFLGKASAAVDKAKGMLEEAINTVAISIQETTRLLFESITGGSLFSFFNFTYGDVVNATITLYIIIYGVGILFGFVQATLLDILIRLAKIAFIYVMMATSLPLPGPFAGGGWGFFSYYVVNFFNYGTEQIIFHITAIASGNPLAGYLDICGWIPPEFRDLLIFSGAGWNPGCAFRILDQSVAIIFSPRMFITMIGAMLTPPYGPIVAIGLVIAVFMFFLVLLQALRVYALSLVAKALLFGLAPIFIVFLLFERTKSMFFAWLGQVISYSLQPIMLFAFLAFFGLLIKSSAADLLPVDDVHLCYTKSETQANTPIDIHSWKFMCYDETGVLKPYTGKWTWNGPEDAQACPPAKNKAFPIDPINVLIFLLLCYLMYKVSGIVVKIANDIAGGLGTTLSDDRLQGYFKI